MNEFWHSVLDEQLTQEAASVISGKTIFDTRPVSNIQTGSYDNHQWSIAEVNQKASGVAFEKTYKSHSLRFLNEMIKPDSVVVDIGCCNCEILHHVKSSRKIGVDICPKSVLDATPNFFDSNVDLLIIADGNHLPLKDDSVDAVLCCDIFEYLLVPEGLLKEVKRVLKPGGILFTSVPNLVHLGNRLSMLVGGGVGVELAQLLKGKSIINPISGPRFPDQRLHLRWFTSNSLRSFLSGLGFEVQSTFGVGPIASRLKLEKLSANTALLAGAIAIKK